jgi:hypothetical protein
VRAGCTSRSKGGSFATSTGPWWHHHYICHTSSACVPLRILRSLPQGLKAKLGPRVGKDPPPALGLLLLLSEDLLDLVDGWEGEP